MKRLLEMVQRGEGRLVSSNDLNEAQIGEAQESGRWHTDINGFGYAVLPWNLRTLKDKERDRA